MLLDTSGGRIDPKYQYIATNVGTSSDQYYREEIDAQKYQYISDFQNITMFQ